MKDRSVCFSVAVYVACQELLLSLLELFDGEWEALDMSKICLWSSWCLLDHGTRKEFDGSMCFSFEFGMCPRIDVGFPWMCDDDVMVFTVIVSAVFFVAVLFVFVVDSVLIMAVF